MSENELTQADLDATLVPAKAAYRAGGEKWVPSNFDVADYFLCVMPPIYGNKKTGVWFGCSEPETHNRAGHAVYLSFRAVGSDEARKYEAAYLTEEEITGSPELNFEPDTVVYRD